MPKLSISPYYVEQALLDIESKTMDLIRSNNDVINGIVALNIKIGGVTEKSTTSLDLSSFDQEMIQEINLASQNSNGDISDEIRNYRNFNLIKFATCKL